MAVTNQSKSFRSDINGLRAWAVVAVILYHFGIGGFGGGFVGVDVFFVISGFLMTRIIIQGLEGSGGKRFSIFAFYLARIRRIVPALFVLCVGVMFVGWFFIPSVEYRGLAEHSISALGFFSNIVFFKESGYFDADSHAKWLLHTWSLSVEWQFYIIMPIVLSVIWKIRPGRGVVALMITLGMMLSQYLSIRWSAYNESLTFFMLPTRAWELLIGGLAFLISERFPIGERFKRAFEIVGLLSIAASVFVFDSNSRWPGWNALVPVVGTALVILAARDQSVFTGNKLVHWLGECSYSLYLWHWPIVVFLFFFGIQGSGLAVATGLLITLLLGKLSHLYVEVPCQKKLDVASPVRNWLIFSVFFIVAVGVTFWVRVNDGVPQRLDSRIDSVFMAAFDKNPRIGECFVSGAGVVPGCTYGGGDLGVIVIGDSHAQSIVRAVEKSLVSKNFNVLDWTLASCPTIFDMGIVGNSGYRCAEFVAWAFEKQKGISPAVPIVMVSRMSGYVFGSNNSGVKYSEVPSFYVGAPFSERSPEFLNSFRQGIIDTACKFSEYRKVYLVRPIPEMGVDVPRVMGRSLILGREKDVSILLSDYKFRQDFVWEAQDAAKQKCGVEILDPLPYLCASGKCSGSSNGLPIYYDDHHLNEHGAEILVPLFKTIAG
ncbi:acyltransferase [Pseudomonas marginalis]|uniref:Acyltransferase n=1 Tax=Pseudomonas marginalis TaxID=298 RepID=A0A9X9FXE7_PSEMA|nr:acyltransferase family protein [Pseudomonas marginalis]TWR59350.1 acyltransferase [Pseudomonas marginalis]SEC73570.1 Peptidoglycan/LPS O-acetylase OafA/YrhL, contains acyltransferase and SGNH-hydrolase domains [Pseudomonas marginalis]